MVTAADQHAKDHDRRPTFVMKEGGGAALFPQVGSEVTLSYKEDGGQKVITRIGAKTAVAVDDAGRRSEMPTVARTTLREMVHLLHMPPS